MLYLLICFIPLFFSFQFPLPFFCQIHAYTSIMNGNIFYKYFDISKSLNFKSFFFVNKRGVLQSKFQKKNETSYNFPFKASHFIYEQVRSFMGKYYIFSYFTLHVQKKIIFAIFFIHLLKFSKHCIR